MANNNDILTIQTLCTELSISKTTAYSLIKQKRIKSGKLGKKIIIKRTDLDDYVNSIIES